MTTRTQLRKQLRSRRKQLTTIARSEKTDALLSRLALDHRFKTAKHIAFYSAFDGEVDLWPLLLHAYNNHKTCYLPVIPKNGARKMRFAPVDINQREQMNRFGINEPCYENKRLVAANKLDLVLMPLVGFNKNGLRLGMGGGFYDRCFSFRSSRKKWLKPRLLGVAFECQKHPLFKKEPWDVLIDGCITENHTYSF